MSVVVGLEGVRWVGGGGGGRSLVGMEVVIGDGGGEGCGAGYVCESVMINWLRLTHC